MGYGEPKRRPGRPATGHLGSSDRHTVITAERSKVDRVPCADPDRRARLEADDEAWLRWYCYQDFWLPFEKPHKAIIEAAREAMTTGGDAIVVAERGIGKSSVLYGMVLKYGLSGEQAFPVYLPHSQKDQEQGIRFWKESLCDNERIAADYPEICAPFVHAGDVAQRLVTTTWRDTGERTGARTLTGMGRAVIVFPDGRGLIGTSSMGGSPRGMHYKPKGKGSIRPTMALIDDLQTDEEARSPDGVQKAIQKINGAIRGLKRAGDSFSIVVAGTCICADDVMAHFLNQRRWHGVRIACVERWPDGWDDLTSETRRLWEEWKEKYESGAGEKAFYRQNKKAMTAGMVITSPRWYYQKHALKAADKREKVSPPVDCYHGVFREYATMGHEAFMAERQQAPVDPIASSPYHLDVDLICSRTDPTLQPRQLPPWAQTVIAATDINISYGLTTVVVAFGADQRAHVLWYGVTCPPPLPCGREDAPGVVLRAVQTALASHGTMLASMNPRPAQWIVDGGGTPQDTVVGFGAVSVRACGLQSTAAFGRDAKMYRPTGKHKMIVREQCHLVSESMARRWLVWNAHYWQEIQQRGWTSAPGLAGSISLCAGHHSDFAAQLVTERLVWKRETPAGLRWEWKRLPGKNDYGDALNMAYMGAAFGGIGTGGGVARRRYVETRKCKVQREQ